MSLGKCVKPMHLIALIPQVRLRPEEINFPLRSELRGKSRLGSTASTRGQSRSDSGNYTSRGLIFAVQENRRRVDQWDVFFDSLSES